jgi:hypothetical protein
MRLGVLAVAAVLVSSASAAARFTPRTLAGVWSGNWADQTSGNAGPAQIVARSLAGNTTLAVSVNFGGGVFGCDSLTPQPAVPLTQGTGVNHWNAHGFLLTSRSKAFGTLTLRYRAPSGNLTASGGNPSCAHGLSWSMIGAFVGSTFSGKMKIRRASGKTAISNVFLTRD